MGNGYFLTDKILSFAEVSNDTTLFPELSKEKDFSFEKTSCGKKIRMDSDAPDLSSNGGLMLFQGMDWDLKSIHGDRMKYTL